MSRRFAWGRRRTASETDREPALQCWLLRLQNIGGTIKHSIISVQNNISAVPSFAWKINGASVTAAPTPLLDATTGFVNGVGILASNKIVIIFDTPEQVDEDAFRIAGIPFNSSGTSGINVRTDHLSTNVNGVQWKRFCLIFSMDGTGADVPIDTTTIASGKEFYVRVLTALV